MAAKGEAISKTDFTLKPEWKQEVFSHLMNGSIYLNRNYKIRITYRLQI